MIVGNGRQVQFLAPNNSVVHPQVSILCKACLVHVIRFTGKDSAYSFPPQIHIDGHTLPACLTGTKDKIGQATGNRRTPAIIKTLGDKISPGVTILSTHPN